MDKQNNRLVGFLYDLMRDHLPVGVVEKLVRENERNDGAVCYSSGHMKGYAQEVAGRLAPPPWAEAVRAQELNTYIANLRVLAEHGGKEVHDAGKLANFLEYCLGRRETP